MGVYDELPWLGEEKEWIMSAMDAGKRLMGICLGAQLLAEVMGGKVYPHEQKEIGWWPISWSDEALRHPLFSHFPKDHEVLHWHGDTFDLPEGTLLMASSEACTHQAFISQDNKVIGLQFHMEVDSVMLQKFAENDPNAFKQYGPWVQNVDEILKERESTMMANRQLLRSMLDKWMEMNWADVMVD